MPTENIKQSASRHYSFTTKYSRRVNTLITETKVGPPFDPGKTKQVNMHIFNAIWDTGATNTVITKNVAQKCGLIPTGMANVRGISGESTVRTYLVSIILRNEVCIPQVRVTEGILSGGADVLIGMDIINRGDFAVTNSDGKTTLSFRIPSIECLDFVKQPDPKIPKVGRNDPCPCGSGKKYKHCHMRKT